MIFLASFLVLMALSLDGFAQKITVTPLGTDRKAYEEALAAAREAGSNGNVDEALKQYSTAHKHARMALMKSEFGTSKQQTFLPNLKGGKPLMIDMPDGLEIPSNVAMEAADFAAEQGRPVEAVYWLKSRYSYNRRLDHDGKKRLIEFMERADALGNTPSQAGFRAELRVAKAQDVAAAVEYRIRKREARQKWLAIYAICAVIYLGIAFAMRRLLDVRPQSNWSTHPLAWKPSNERTWRQFKQLPWIIFLIVFCAVGAGVLHAVAWDRPTKSDFPFAIAVILAGPIFLALGVIWTSRPSRGYKLTLESSHSWYWSGDMAGEAMRRFDALKSNIFAAMGIGWTNRKANEQAIAQVRNELGYNGIPKDAFDVWLLKQSRTEDLQLDEQPLMSTLVSSTASYGTKWIDVIREIWPHLNDVERRHVRNQAPTGIAIFMSNFDNKSVFREDELIHVNLAMAMYDRLLWTKEEFLNLIACRSLQAWTHGLVWAEYGQDYRPRTRFRIDEDGSFVDVLGDVVELSGYRVGVAHPGDLTPSEVDDWNEHFADFELIVSEWQWERVGVEPEPVADIEVKVEEMSAYWGREYVDDHSVIRFPKFGYMAQIRHQVDHTYRVSFHAYGYGANGGIVQLNLDEVPGMIVSETIFRLNDVDELMYDDPWL